MTLASGHLQSLAIVLVVAAVVPLVLARIRRARIPIVVGEIAAGMLIGRSGLQLVEWHDWLSFLGFLGLAYLMFLTGFEIDFKALGRSGADDVVRAPTGPHPLLLGFLFLLLTLAGAYAFAEWVVNDGLAGHPLFLALIIGTTALTVVVPVLKENGIASTYYGQVLLSSAMIADVVTMLLLSLATTVFLAGGVTVEVLWLPAFILVAIVCCRVAIWAMDRNARTGTNGLLNGAARATSQQGVRLSMAAMAVFLVFADALAVKLILGAFVAGIIAAQLPWDREERLHERLESIGFGFLIPIFFLGVGVNLDLAAIINDPAALRFVPLLLAATYLLKGLPVLLLRSVCPWRETLAASVLLTTQLTVTIAAAEVSLQVGAISEAVYASVVFVAAVTSVISPTVFSQFMSPPQEVPQWERSRSAATDIGG